MERNALRDRERSDPLPRRGRDLRPLRIQREATPLVIVIITVQDYMYMYMYTKVVLYIRSSVIYIVRGNNLFPR